jgi:hypothetical protein
LANDLTTSIVIPERQNAIHHRLQDIADRFARVNLLPQIRDHEKVVGEASKQAEFPREVVLRLIQQQYIVDRVTPLGYGRIKGGKSVPAIGVEAASLLVASVGLRQKTFEKLVTCQHIICVEIVILAPSAYELTQGPIKHDDSQIGVLGIREVISSQKQQIGLTGTWGTVYQKASMRR